MPQTNLTRQASLKSREHLSGKYFTWYPNETIIYDQQVMMKDRPSTVRRIKPKDLFANATARTVRSAHSNVIRPGEFNYGVVQNYDYGLYRLRTARLGNEFAFFAGGLYPPSTTDFGSLENRALGDIKDQKVNLSVSIPELGKTTDMLASLVRETFSFYSNLRSGRTFRDLARDLAKPVDRGSKKLASRWLEFQYGITPLAYEIYGLSEMITQKIITGHYIYGMVRDKRTYSGQLYYNSQHPTTAHYSGYNKCITNDEVLRRINYRYMVDNQGLRSLAQSGITNPALTVWELVPYSFVFDWFIDVGGALNTLDALVGVKNLQVIKGYKFKRSALTSLSVWPNLQVSVIKDGQSHILGVETYRSGITTLTPRFPRYEPHVSQKRMLSALALFRNLFK